MPWVSAIVLKWNRFREEKCKGMKKNFAEKIAAKNLTYQKYASQMFIIDLF